MSRSTNDWNSWRAKYWNGGLVCFTVKVNLRWLKRPICWLHWHHPQQDVISIHPLMGAGFTYCKRCGKGWRYCGYAKCWLPRQHQWGPDPWSMGPSTNRDGTPFREVQRCPRCNGTRVIECATGEVVGLYA